MAGSGWGWEPRVPRVPRNPDVLVPGPVVRGGLSVGLMGELIHLGQRSNIQFNELDEK